MLRKLRIEHCCQLDAFLQRQFLVLACWETEALFPEALDTLAVEPTSSCMELTFCPVLGCFPWQ